MVKLRLAVLGLALAVTGAPALAHEFGSSPTSLLAPADEYFGRAKMSILGIANTIRDAGRRLDQGGSPSAMLQGPLFLAVDAIRDWEHKYPSDHWIPRNLLALEMVYLRGGTRESFGLARRTAAWIATDYPNTQEAQRARLAVGTPERPSYAHDAVSADEDVDDSWPH
jgi:hypothetical protein